MNLKNLREEHKNMCLLRNIPATASGANSQAKEVTPDNALFDGLLGLDGELDNLFG